MPAYRAFCLTLLLLTAAAPSPLRAQQSHADSVADRCIGDTTAPWTQVSRRWSSEVGRHWSNDSLRHVLLALRDSDQAVRQSPSLADSMRDSAFVRRMIARDSLDAAALRQIVVRYGWPTKSLVGAEGASAAFLIAQHNASLQPEALRLMGALPAGEVSPSDLAMLEDRVRVSQGKPQRYGTQLAFADSGRRMVFDSIEDVAHLDERRAAAGLPPMTSYLCLMREMYGRDVADPRGKRHR
jgi:hypothetical protein